MTILLRLSRGRQTVIRYADLIAVSGAQVAALIVLQSGDGLPSVVDAGLAALAVFILPGYAVLMAILPRRLHSSHRVVLALGLGMAIPVALALVLNILPWGLGRTQWIAGLSITTMAAIAIAAAQRMRARASIPWRPRIAVQTLRATAVFAVAAAVIALAISVRVGGGPMDGSSFTQMWAIPADDTSAGSVELRIVSRESAEVIYRLGVTIDGEPDSTFDITLAPGEEWSDFVRVVADKAMTVEAVLYRLPDLSTQYRRVTITTPGSS